MVWTMVLQYSNSVKPLATPLCCPEWSIPYLHKSSAGSCGAGGGGSGGGAHVGLHTHTSRDAQRRAACGRYRAGASHRTGRSHVLRSACVRRGQQLTDVLLQRETGECMSRAHFMYFCSIFPEDADTVQCLVDDAGALLNCLFLMFCLFLDSHNETLACQQWLNSVFSV